MRMKHEYAIKQETMVILPEYNTEGYLHSRIYNRHGVSTTDLSPFDLIDYNLRFFGSSLRGSLDGARTILGNGSMNPVILHKELDILLFPCKSPFKEDCVWFSLRHVTGSVSAGKSQTQVSLSNGSTITINVSKHAFNKRIQKAYEFRFKMQARQKEFENHVSELESPYHLFKDADGGIMRKMLY